MMPQKTLSAKQGKTLKDLIGTALADLTTSVKTSIILAINSLVTVKEDKVTITTDASSTTPTVSLSQTTSMYSVMMLSHPRYNAI